MIGFLATGWLWAAGAAAVGGAWGVLAGRVRRIRVSAVWLWRDLEGTGGGRRRRVDPVWSLVAAAGVIAALALADPVWRSGAEGGPLPTWSVRSVGERTEAWVSGTGGELRVDGQVRRVEGVERGVAVDLGPGDEHTLAWVRGGRAAAEAVFRRPASGGFEVLEVGRVDPALRRVFAVQPGAHGAEGAAGDERVVLVNDPAFALGDARGAALCVVEGPAALEGIAMTGSVEGNRKVEAVDVPAFVEVGGVTVRRMAKAEVSGEWHVVMRAGGLPWVAERRVVSGDGATTVVWLASRPAECDWAADRSFVLYFSDLLRRAVPVRAGGNVPWPKQEGVAEPGTTVRLSPALGVAAAGLLLGAMGLLWRRGR
jgi:hypothetical protein